MELCGLLLSCGFVQVGSYMVGLTMSEGNRRDACYMWRR